MIKTIDLWPEDIATKRVRAPITILREQAALLGQKTGNLVQGDVTSNQHSSKDYFAYRFYIEAPTLDNYSYKLFSIYHHIDFYPLEINTEQDIVQEVSNELKVGQDEAGELTIFVEDEEEFIKALGLIFRAEKTMRVITALLSQTDPEWNYSVETEEEEIPF
ncbi:MAG: hypothetical protein KDE19_03925 [Caldilineaceae bacterium]|nr:hypothetical protein [Caldilineaceae bacterium]